MSEALKAIIDYCFSTTEIDALTCGHFKSNIGSRRVIEKCGFQYVKDSVYEAKQMNQSFEDQRYIIRKKDR